LLPVCGCGLAERREQRREAVVVVAVRVGAERQQLLDEPQRTPVDARRSNIGPTAERHRVVGKVRRVVDGRPQRRHVAGGKRRVDALQAVFLRAGIRHGSPYFCSSCSRSFGELLELFVVRAVELVDVAAAERPSAAARTSTASAAPSDRPP
jgi:hypothetical protein